MARHGDQREPCTNVFVEIATKRSRVNDRSSDFRRSRVSFSRCFSTKDVATPGQVEFLSASENLGPVERNGTVLSRSKWPFSSRNDRKLTTSETFHRILTPRVVCTTHAAFLDAPRPPFNATEDYIWHFTVERGETFKMLLCDSRTGKPFSVMHNRCYPMCRANETETN